jgi:hypothetical protein
MNTTSSNCPIIPALARACDKSGVNTSIDWYRRCEVDYDCASEQPSCTYTGDWNGTAYPLVNFPQVDCEKEWFPTVRDEAVSRCQNPVLSGCTKSSNGSSFIMVWSDTVYQIAQQFGVDPDRLCVYNNMTNCSDLAFGCSALAIPVTPPVAPSGTRATFKCQPDTATCEEVKEGEGGVPLADCMASDCFAKIVGTWKGKGTLLPGCGGANYGTCNCTTGEDYPITIAFDGASANVSFPCDPSPLGVATGIQGNFTARKHFFSCPCTSKSENECISDCDAALVAAVSGGEMHGKWKNYAGGAHWGAFIGVSFGGLRQVGE